MTAIVALGALLLAAAVIPASVLPHGAVRHVIYRRRLDVGLLGGAMLIAIALAYFVVYFGSSGS